MYKESLTMNMDDFERFNFLSQKLLDQTALSQEINEFHQLLKQWKVSQQTLLNELIDP